MASIQKLDNKKGVSYRVQIRRRGLPNIYKTFLSKKQANLFALKLEDNARDHKAYCTKLSFNELVESYLSNAYLGTKPQMQHSRLKHWLGILGDKSIMNINRSDIELGLKNLPEGLSNTTINKYKKLVSVVFNYGIRELGLLDNPTRYIRSLPEKKGRTRYLSDNERERLFKACRDSKWDKLYLLVLMAITTGARRGELLSLRWNSVDIDKQTAYVLTSKNGEPKVLPLTNNVIKELERFSSN